MCENEEGDPKFGERVWEEGAIELKEELCDEGEIVKGLPRE